MKVIHIISGTEIGGAERTLHRLLTAWGSSIDNVVIGLAPDGPLAETIRDLRVEVHSLNLRRGSRLPISAGVKLASLLREAKPDIVQGWMYHGNLAATAATAIARLSKPVLWNIRNARHFHERSSPNSRFAIRWCRRLSHRPNAIIYNSELVRRDHAKSGYADDQGVVIHNGIPIEQFREADARRSASRILLGLGEHDTVVGYVARVVPLKNHAGFLEAAAAVHRERPDVRFLIAGTGATPENGIIGETVKRLGLSNVVTVLGARDDVSTIFAAIDIAASSSRGEGFPNAIAEAMASGRPAVATDVGGTAMLIADTGIVVEAGDPFALADGIVRLIDLGVAGRQALGVRAQQRIQQHFTIGAIASQYADLYQRIQATGAPLGFGTL